MRVVDVIYAVPSLLYIILISLLFGSASIHSLLLGMSISGWIGTSRLVRSQILSLKSQEYALAAQVCGAGAGRILFRHLLINALGPIIVQTTLMVPQFIFMEAFLSFLGIGISAPRASLGSLAQDARTLITVYPLQMVFPVVMICFIIFALNFIGEGLGSALNPKSGGRA
jgi:oligopeptide transport system permease protein